MDNFFVRCLGIIVEKDIPTKIKLIADLNTLFHNNEVLWESTPAIVSIDNPGRPESPNLVHPTKVAKRRFGSVAGIASLTHALAHIEFNAINLAIDACYRFQNMPYQYYVNWLEVAIDEAYHFGMLADYLVELGYKYGDFDAHNGLWDMALQTEKSVIARMALVPRVLEARGLDAIPEIQKKLQASQDTKLSAILDIIHRDEIRHVRYGDEWFKYCCAESNLDYEATFFELLQQYDAPKIRGAFNRIGRQKAGFSDSELDRLMLIANS